MIMIAILTIVIPFIIFGSMFAMVYWGTHLDMTRAYDFQAIRLSFSQFKMMYEQKTWERTSLFPESLFEVDNHGKTQLHASLIQFDGTYYKLGLLGYARFSVWKRRQLTEYQIIRHPWS